MKRRFILSTILIFTVLSVFELCFANRQSIALLMGKNEEKSIVLSECSIIGKYETDNDGNIVLGGDVSIVINGIDAVSRNIVFETEELDRYITFSMEKKDHACSTVYRKTGDYRFVPEGLNSFFLCSDGELYSVRICMKSCTGLVLKGIGINKRCSFSFNIIRFVLLFAAATAICAVVSFKLYRIVYEPYGTKLLLSVLIPFLLCLPFICLTTVKNVGFDAYPLTHPIEEYDEYTQLFDAFRKHQTNLDIKFDEEAYEKLDNPYDYYERRYELGNTGGLWDRVYYQGKIYCYFGAAPVLTVYYPLYFLTGYVPREGTVGLILTVAATFAIIMLCVAAIRHYRLKLSLLLVIAAETALCTSSLIYLLNAHPSMYYNALLSGILFLALTFNLTFRAADSQTDLRCCINMTLAALCIVGVVTSRPTLALFAISLAPIYMHLFFGKETTKKAKLLSMLCFAVPLVIGAFGVMAYNRTRFGSPFDFGNNYQLTFSDISYSKLTLQKFFPAMYHYFLQSPSFSGFFPYIDLNSVNLNCYGGYTYLFGTVGAFSFPASLGIFALPLTTKNKPKRFTFISLAVIAVFVAFTDTCMAGVHIRYLSDIAFAVAFAGIFVLLEIAEKSASLGGSVHKYVTALCFALFTLSVAMAFGLVFNNEANNLYRLSPSAFRFIENLFI